MEEYFLKYQEYLPPLNTIQIKRLNKYFHFLTNTAKNFGFIGKTNEEILWLRHILDSLIVLKGNIEIGNTVMDMGTGAGLPGMPLKIALPQKHFFLVDSSMKKIKFLEELIDQLNITHVKAIRHNVCKTYKKVHTLVFRAFKSPLVSLEIATRHVRYLGKILYWRAKPFDTSPFKKEIYNRISSFGLEIEDHIPLECPDILGHRGVYVFKLMNRPINDFPREWHEIISDPLNQKIK